MIGAKILLYVLAACILSISIFGYIDDSHQYVSITLGRYTRGLGSGALLTYDITTSLILIIGAILIPR